MNIIIINLTKIHWDWKFLLDIFSEEKSVKIFQSGGILSSNTHPLQQQSFSTPSYHGPAYRQPFPGLWPGFHFILHSQLFSSLLLLVLLFRSLVVWGPVQSSCTVLLLFLTIGIFSEHVPDRLMVYPFSLASGNDCA